MSKVMTKEELDEAIAELHEGKPDDLEPPDGWYPVEKEVWVWSHKAMVWKPLHSPTRDIAAAMRLFLDMHYPNISREMDGFKVGWNQASGVIPGSVRLHFEAFPEPGEEDVPEEEQLCRTIACAYYEAKTGERVTIKENDEQA